MAEPTARKKADVVTVVIVGLLLLSAVVMGYHEAISARLLTAGSAAPGFVMPRPVGGAVTLEELKGRVVLLDFWASWCAPCREEMPTLVKLAREYEARGVTFVAANRDDVSEQKEAVGWFLKQVPSVGPYAAYSTPEIASDYLVQALPTLYVIDRAGNVVTSMVGVESEHSIRRSLDEALAAQR